MSYGVYLRLGKNLCGRFINNRMNYKQYRGIVKDWSAHLNQTSCSDIIIGKVSKSVVKANGYKKETLETLQTTEFLEAFHRFLGKKGYDIPKHLEFWEHLLPRKGGFQGITLGKSILYNPRCINTIDFRVPIHETGHLKRCIQNKFVHPFSPFGLRMGKDNYKFMFGTWLKRIPFVKNRYKDHMLCHLSKEEQIALRSDYARAYKEGYFKHNPFYNTTKERVAEAKNSEKAQEIRRTLNKIARKFKKTPEDFYLPNSQLNREEFMADYFNLAAQGFEFSPIVTAKYLKYGGPKIGEVITAKELDQLEKLRKQISKKSLGDYGYSWYD